MTERFGEKVIMNIVGWLCLPTIVLSLILSIVPTSSILAVTGNIATNSANTHSTVVETLRRDFFLKESNESTGIKLASNDPFQIAKEYIRWLPERTVRDRQVICLAKNIWFESRGETTAGQLGVAMVTLNRLHSDIWPKTVCEVVYDPWQFTWTTKPSLRNRVPSGEQWEEILMLSATLLYRQDLFDDITNGATFFHATYVRPKWSHLEHTFKVGRHIFYKPKQLKKTK